MTKRIHSGAWQGWFARILRRCQIAGLEGARSLEGLPQAEEEVEVRRLADVWVEIGVRLRVVDVNGVDGRVEVVAEIEADGPDRGVIAQADAGRMGEVVEAADSLLSCGGVGALGWTDGAGCSGRSGGGIGIGEDFA